MTVYTLMADGCEEVEALTVADLLRRAGIDTRLVSIHDREMTEGSHGIGIRSDAKLSEIYVDQEDMIFLPGGMPGTTYMKESEAVRRLIVGHAAEGGRLAAICAAPSVLAMLGLLEGKRAACHASVESLMEGAKLEKTPVVTDGLITTSRGMGTAIQMGLELIRILKDKEEADRIAAAIMLP